MYLPVEGGSVEHIYGIDCYIPPPPPKDEIANFLVPKEDQVWQRNELPTFLPRDIDLWTGTVYEPEDRLDWDQARREEIARQTGYDEWDLDRSGKPKRVPGIRPDPSYVSHPLAMFRSKELDRCDPWTGGYWIYINGEPTYLTPFHYFFVNWWEINVGYPDYRDTDRKIFYLWQWAFENPQCKGLCEVAKRGGGKTYRALSVLYLRTIYGKNILSGIQSKTDKDSEDMFILKLVECYKNLPDFLVPINANSTDPKSELRFFSQSKSGKVSLFDKLQQKKAIRSTINYKNAQEKAYDGQTINGVLIRDEEGKTKKSVCDVWERHMVTKDCVFRDGKIFGKIYSTTTVEKLESGGEQFKILWDASNQRKVPLDDNPANTISGLIRVFFPSYQTEYFDDYGMPMVEKARKRQQGERDKYKNDPSALLQEILQFPWNERELFRSAGDSCQYDLSILRAREMVVNDPDFNAVRRGDFYWEGGIFGGKALWKDNYENGKWVVAHIFDDPKTQSNKVLRKQGLNGPVFEPLNEDAFCGGFDPTKTASDPKKRRSMAAGTVFMKDNFWIPELSNTWIALFVDQPLDPEAAYLEFLIGLFYYGCPFLPEDNLGIPIKIKEMGCGDFVMNRPRNTFTTNNLSQNTPGMPSNATTNDMMVKRKQTHIVKHGHKMIIPKIISDSIEFDPQQRTKYDVEVASQLSLIASERPMPAPKIEAHVTSLFQMYDHSGSRSSILNNKN
jgi:hypothetical protein